MKIKISIISLAICCCMINCISNSKERKQVKMNYQSEQRRLHQTLSINGSKNRMDSIPNDTIAYDKIKVRSLNASDLQLLDSVNLIVNIFGAADSIYNYYYEIDSKYAQVYQYRGARFYFLDGKLDSYEIRDNSFLVGNASVGPYFTVGDNISKLTPYIPNYLANKKDGRIFATITGIPREMFIYIEYNLLTEKIITISIRSY